MAWNSEGLDWQIMLGLGLVGWFAPRLADTPINKIEAVLGRLATRPGLSLLLVCTIPILIRLLLLPVLVAPQPAIHDEFSYLLAADTFAHGRLTNHAHAMWVYFDTFHVLQHPTYASMYPPAQGAVLAIGQLLGHPWIGVLFSMGAMCGSFFWMLKGWVPPRWALLGSMLVAAHFSIFSYWMNSYWGGAVAALGGALVMGAFPRILRTHKSRDALILVLGAGILANSRPLEGFVLCIPVAIVIAKLFLSTRGKLLRKVGIPIGAGLCVVLAFTLYYNWVVTGDPLLFPHALDSNTYETVPVFIWQKAKAPLQYSNPQFNVFYNIFERSAVISNWSAWKDSVGDRLGQSYRFFLGPSLLLAFAALWPVCVKRKTGFLVLQFVLCFTASLLVIWFQPHYLAPAMATLFILVVQCLRHVRRWRVFGRPVGIGLTRAVVISSLIAPLVTFGKGPSALYNPDFEGPKNYERAEITRELQSKPGNQLVLVRYTKTHHNVHSEWVYNSADIDHAKIVWAREIPGLQMESLLKYFADRKVWIVEPDEYPVHIKPFTPILSTKLP